MIDVNEWQWYCSNDHVKMIDVNEWQWYCAKNNVVMIDMNEWQWYCANDTWWRGDDQYKWMTMILY
jgi:hypothetical protein